MFSFLGECVCVIGVAGGCVLLDAINKEENKIKESQKKMLENVISVEEILAQKHEYISKFVARVDNMEQSQVFEVIKIEENTKDQNITYIENLVSIVHNLRLNKNLTRPKNIACDQSYRSIMLFTNPQQMRNHIDSLYKYSSMPLFANGKYKLIITAKTRFNWTFAGISPLSCLFKLNYNLVFIFCSLLLFLNKK